MPEVFLCPISLIRMGYLHGVQLAELEFQAVFWIVRLRRIVDDHGTIVRTADEDEGLMVYTTRTQLNQPGVAWVCDWRTGDFW